ncbi:helix-turn-helix domain-containing protein [Nocardia sp. NBC_01503]|uniref:helix-turn-helix domain-containing protein n=1 Tax=Nocardia sp. NBC_01503 TaxID=2975997 RepID=UPI002E7BFA5A|nr:helix-turn-helix domain-containing protein [Nocardia sp. NBC_01503]WTL30318.1 helix-turn-helix domain-containing protein [Nocardia sp. NBC_01503]
MHIGRDRLRELLDAVLAQDNSTLGAMAADAYSSPFHFSRQFAHGTGESPVALRRRVLLERAGWQLSRGESVTEVAFAAGYESVEGFSRAYSRAYGHPPSGTGSERAARWLPTVNGVHFHPPMSLWVQREAKGRPDMDPTAVMLHHDVDDIRELLERAAGLTDEGYRRVRAPGFSVLDWDGVEESIAGVLANLVWTREVWLAAIDGADTPEKPGDDASALRERFEELVPRWLGAVRDIDARGAWSDTLIDALCEPPESFVLGSVIAHVLTYSAHRRLLVRAWLRAEKPDDAAEIGHGDPIMWLRRRG